MNQKELLDKLYETGASKFFTGEAPTDAQSNFDKYVRECLWKVYAGGLKECLINIMRLGGEIYAQWNNDAEMTERLNKSREARKEQSEYFQEFYTTILEEAYDLPE